MRCSNLLALYLALGCGTASVEAIAQMTDFKNIGRTPSAEEINVWDISISPDGKGLPPGRGTAQQGAKVFAQKCASCHGATGVEPPAGSLNIRRHVLVGGKGTLNTAHPVKTIGSYWPFATTLWDYINRAMPRNAEGTLSADEVYSLTAYLLYRNDIIHETDVVDAKTLPKIQMPNRHGFVPPEPIWKPGEKRQFGIYP